MVEVDEKDYQRGVEELNFSVMGRLPLHRGDLIPTTIELKNKLVHCLKIVDIKGIPLGNGLFHILLHSLRDQCKALTVGSVFLKLGVMRFNRWLQGFNASKQM